MTALRLRIVLLVCVLFIGISESKSVQTPFSGVMPASGVWQYSFLNSHSDTVRLSIQTLSGQTSVYLRKESRHWSSSTSTLEVAGETDLEGMFNLEIRGLQGSAVEGSYVVYCGNVELTQESLLVENYQWYNYISQGQVTTYKVQNRFTSNSSITVRLIPLDSSCDPDLYIFQGLWNGTYGWQSAQESGEDAVTISTSAAVKDITGAYTIEVHARVPGLYMLRVAISYTSASKEVQATKTSGSVEEYFWYHTVEADTTDYYFFRNRHENAVSIDFFLSPLSAGDPYLRVYKGQWTGAYDWTSGSGVLSVKDQRGGIAGDYTVEVRGVLAATYKIEVKLHYNDGWMVHASGVVQNEDKSFLFVRDPEGLSPGDVAFLELADGSTEALLTVHVPQPSRITVSLAPCVSTIDLLIPPEQLSAPVTYESHRDEIFASFFADRPGDIRVLVRGDDPDFMEKLPYRIAVESDESFERRETLTWETLGNDKLVVSWPPLRLSVPGTVRYRVFLSLATASDKCGISEHDIEVLTSVPTAVLTLTEDAGSRAISVLAEVEGGDWRATVPYMRKHIGVGWNWVRITVLVGLVAAVAVVCWKQKGASWSGTSNAEVYRRLIEEKD